MGSQPRLLNVLSTCFSGNVIRPLGRVLVLCAIRLIPQLYLMMLRMSSARPMMKPTMLQVILNGLPHRPWTSTSTNMRCPFGLDPTASPGVVQHLAAFKTQLRLVQDSLRCNEAAQNSLTTVPNSLLKKT